jgi:glutamate dehydrogenase
VLRTAAGKIRPSKLIAQLAEGVTKLAGAREELLAGKTREQSATLRAGFIELGAPAALAGRVADLFDYDGAVGLARLALDTGVEPKCLTHAFTDIGGRLGLDWAQGTAAHMSPSDVWERLLVDGLARDFQQMRLEFLHRQLKRKDGKDNPSGAVAEWAGRNAAAVAQFRSLVLRAQSRPPCSPAMLAQIAAQARNLLHR